MLDHQHPGIVKSCFQQIVKVMTKHAIKLNKATAVSDDEFAEAAKLIAPLLRLIRKSKDLKLVELATESLLAISLALDDFTDNFIT